MITDELRQLIIEAADIAVAKYAALCVPKAIEASQRQLYREFGEAWVKRQIRTGRPEFAGRRRGNRILYDRSAFAAEYEAQRYISATIKGKYANPHTTK